MKVISLRCTAIASAAILVAGCANAPGQPDFGAQLKQTFASDDPCSNNARNIGVVGGAVLGALLGNAIGGGKDESKIIGAALGSVVGGFVGADMDRKRQGEPVNGIWFGRSKPLLARVKLAFRLETDERQGGRRVGFLV